MSSKSRRRLAALATSLLAASLSAGVAAAPKTPQPPKWELRGPYAPVIDPANFVSRIDNRYFPLRPGTHFSYRGVKDGAAQTDEVVVTSQVKVVLGVRCTVVRDTVFAHGQPLERTLDWYAQDKQGNVWYMGEDSFELQHGRFVRASDSWQAGVRQAKPGIIMRANPRPGDVYRQEYYPPGGALDQARVVGSSRTVRVGARTFRGVLVTDEWSPVEPQMERKEYAPGVGEIQEAVTRGGHERFALYRVTR